MAIIALVGFSFFWTDPVCGCLATPKTGIGELLFFGVLILERRETFELLLMFSMLSVVGCGWRNGERFGDEVRIEALDIEDPEVEVKFTGNECSLWFASSLNPLALFKNL